METKKVNKTDPAESAWKNVAKRTVITTENKPKPQKTVADKKGKAITKEAYEDAARRNVAPSGKGPKILSKKPVKEGEAVTKEAYEEAARRTVNGREA